MTRRRTAIVSAYAGLLGLLLLLGTRDGFGAYQWLQNWAWQQSEAALGAFSWTLWTGLAGGLQALMGGWLVLILVCAAPLGAAALVARSFAWRRVRSGFADPLEALRRRPWAMRLAAWAPGAAYLAMYLRRLFAIFDPSPDPLPPLSAAGPAAVRPDRARHREAGEHGDARAGRART